MFAAVLFLFNFFFSFFLAFSHLSVSIQLHFQLDAEWRKNGTSNNSDKEKAIGVTLRFIKPSNKEEIDVLFIQYYYNHVFVK